MVLLAVVRSNQTVSCLQFYPPLPACDGDRKVRGSRSSGLDIVVSEGDRMPCALSDPRCGERPEVVAYTGLTKVGNTAFGSILLISLQQLIGG